jgi:RNA polymerase sigma-70 factor (ECF subfamily)
MKPYEKIISIKLKQGDREIFKELYKLYYSRLYYFSKEYVNDEHVAETIVNDCFLTLWKKRDSLHENSNLNAYLYTLCKNNCITYINRILSKEKITEYLSDEYIFNKLNYDALVNLDTSELSFHQLESRVELAINSLPPQCQKIFRLSRYDNLKNKEIADELNISVKAVEAQISKALKVLRVQLKDYVAIYLFLFVN